VVYGLNLIKIKMTRALYIPEKKFSHYVDKSYVADLARKSNPTQHKHNFLTTILNTELFRGFY